MLNTEFGDDFGMYSGDGEYVIWIAETCEGMLIWVGYLYMIMMGCWTSDYSDKGMLYCWDQLAGFDNDEVWEMKHFRECSHSILLGNKTGSKERLKME